MRRTDETITGDIIAAFAENPHIPNTNLRIQTKDSYVRIQGVVDTLEEKHLAGEIAKGIEGVRILDNDIVIGARGMVDDHKLAEKVQDHLVKKGNSEIGVRVEAGNAYLMGIVPSKMEKENAMEIASQVQGIREVYSELQIAAGKPVDDITLANDVSEALSEDGRLELIDLHVEAEDSIVTINGEVITEEQIEIASQIAKNVPGVKEVHTRLGINAI